MLHKRLCHGLPALLGVFLFLAIVLGVWFFVLRDDVMSFGAEGKTYFKPAVATEGDAIEICFDDAAWYRVCPSRLITYLTPAKGPRLDDLPVYTLKMPAKPQKTPQKCRLWHVPVLGPDRSEGPAVLTGHVESECSLLDYGHPIITPFPTLRVEIKKRR